MWFFLITFITISIALYLREIRRPKNYPPGPDWLPILGNARELKKLSITLGGHHLAFNELVKQYKSNVIGLKLGGQLTILVSGYEAVRHVLVGDEYIGRPDNFFMNLRCMGKRRGITSMDGPIWAEQRNFVVCHLRNIGFGKKTMEKMVHNEVETILGLLKENESQIQLEPVFAYSVLNVLWSFVTGKQLSKTDPRLGNFLVLLNKRSKAFDMAGGTLNHMPWLRHFIPEQIGYNLILQLNQELKDFFTESIKEHYENWHPDKEDDLIYSFITEMRKNQYEENAFTNDQLLMICLDLFIAGSNTTSHTLDFICLNMVLHPEIQEKAAECIRAVLNYQEFVTYADRLKMSYLEAIIMETERFSGVVPIVGPRRVLRDTTLNGYNIPKETTVLISTHSVSHDQNYWGDPEVFRPERFIDEEGKLLSGERVYNFGLGKRRCLGELLARQCIFVFFANILKNYKLCPVSEKQMPSNVILPGIILTAPKYKVKLEKRCIY